MPDSKRRGCLWRCCLFGGSVPATGLPHAALIEEEGAQSYCIYHGWLITMGGQLPISEEKRRRSGWVGEVEKGTGMRGGRGNFGWKVKKQNKTKTGKNLAVLVKETWTLLWRIFADLVADSEQIFYCRSLGRLSLNEFSLICAPLLVWLLSQSD